MYSLGCVYNSQVAQLKGCVDWITQNSPHRSFELDVPNTKLVSTKQSAASAPTLKTPFAIIKLSRCAMLTCLYFSQSNQRSLQSRKIFGCESCERGSEKINNLSAAWSRYASGAFLRLYRAWISSLLVKDVVFCYPKLQIICLLS
jgi:hypothetical protein